MACLSKAVVWFSEVSPRETIKRFELRKTIMENKSFQNKEEECKKKGDGKFCRNTSKINFLNRRIK